MFKGRTRLCVLCDCINSHGQTDSSRREEWKVGGADSAAALLKGISVKNGLVARNKDILSPNISEICCWCRGTLRKHGRKVRLTSWEREASLSGSSSLPDLLSHLLGMSISFLFLDRMLLSKASITWACMRIGVPMVPRSSPQHSLRILSSKIPSVLQ